MARGTIRERFKSVEAMAKDVIRVSIQVLYSEKHSAYIEMGKNWIRSFIEHVGKFKDVILELLFLTPPEITCPLECRVIRGSIEDNLSTSIVERTLLGIAYAKEHSFDFIFRSNLSSVVCWEGFCSVLKDLPRTNCYAGKVGFAHLRDNPTLDLPVTFCSGSGFFLSRDLFENFSCFSELRPFDISKDMLDDVFVGRVLMHTPRLSLKRFDLTEKINVSESVLNSICYDIKKWSYHHMRINSGNRETQDLLLHRELFRMVNN